MMAYYGKGMTLQAGPWGRTVLAEGPVVKPAGLVTDVATGMLKNWFPRPPGSLVELGI